MGVGDGFAYMLNGLDGATSWPNRDKHFLPGMIEFNTASHTFSNVSTGTGAVGPSGKLAFGGTMQYVPYFGLGGLFVIMGGQEEDDGYTDFETLSL